MGSHAYMCAHVYGCLPEDAEIDAADETPTSASARGSDSAEDEDLDEVVSLATDDEEDEEEQAAEGTRSLWGDVALPVSPEIS